jgi:hypothetical protein
VQQEFGNKNGELQLEMQNIKNCKEKYYGPDITDPITDPITDYGADPITDFCVCL